MEAIIKPAYETKRLKLSEVLPLDTPYRITVSPTHLCNLKCFYCTHSLDKREVEKTGFKYRDMKFDEFKQLADQLLEFPHRLKLMIFSGMGEPLLNKDFPKMIGYAKRNKVAERIEMYSNATLLNPELTHKLIDAGLDEFKISIEGLDAPKYKEVGKVNIDYSKFLKGIEYFYSNRGNCKIYIKIIDAALEEGGEQNFYDIFGGMCDYIYIEHLSDCQPLTGDCEGRVNKAKTMYGEDAIKTKICPMLFYSIYADADCNIYPCVTLALPVSFSIGNFRDTKIIDMWNGAKVKQLRLTHLKGNKDSIPVCRECGNMICMYHKEDDLDDDAERLTDLYGGG